MKIELKSLDDIDPCQLAYFANDIHVNRYLRNSFPYPYTLDHALSFITYSLQHQNLDFGIVVDDICIGCIGVTFQKDIYVKNCEIGYWIGYDYWGQGITSKVVKLIVDFLFHNFTITKINAEIFSDNIGSQKVLEKCGFEKEGYLKKQVYKNGEYFDVILYGLRKEIYEYKKVK